MRVTLPRSFRSATVGLLMATLGVAAAGEIGAAEPAARLTFSEDYRHEQLTTEELSGFSTVRETKIAYKGKLKLTMEIPGAVNAALPLELTTPILIEMGEFRFQGTLADDPLYRPGRTEAQFTVRSPRPSGKNHGVLGTVKLRWDARKLTARVEMETPAGGKPVAAADFVEKNPGEIHAETRALFQWGSQRTQWTVPLHGQSRRKTAGNDSIQGRVVTIDLRGEASNT